MADELTFKQQLISDQLTHRHNMEEKRHRLLVTGQRWAGSIACLGVGGTITCVLVGANGWAIGVISAEFAAIIGFFLYRKDVQVPGSISPGTADANVGEDAVLEAEATDRT
ncbi:hypothetical protein [Arthrobacter sp. CP30]